MKITVTGHTKASPDACFKAATDPEAIKVWNTASPEWHCPSAAVDLRVGGRMESRMEAVDGSMGFDFAATFTEVDPPRRLAYKLDDDRLVELELEAADGGTNIKQTFDAEAESDPEFQRAGWQSIMDSFVAYCD